MIAHHRSTLLSALLGAGIVLLYLWARAAFAAADDPPVLVDAGTLDRAALIATVDAGPADLGPYRTPGVVAPSKPDESKALPAPPGMSAETLTWDYIKAGGGASLAMRLIFWIGTALLASQEWLARRWPKIATGRNLATVSSVVGAMLTLGRGAALSGGAMTWLALAEAVMSAVLLVTRPEPRNVAGQTVPA